MWIRFLSHTIDLKCVIRPMTIIFSGFVRQLDFYFPYGFFFSFKASDNTRRNWKNQREKLRCDALGKLDSSLCNLSWLLSSLYLQLIPSMCAEICCCVFNNTFTNSFAVSKAAPVENLNVSHSLRYDGNRNRHWTHINMQISVNFALIYQIIDRISD